MGKQFIGERIEPAGAFAHASAMAVGEPAVPARFLWRGDEYEVARVLARWKETGPCRSGGGERYVRKHWFRVLTTDGQQMRIYFERQARSGRQARSRWWLYSLTPP